MPVSKEAPPVLTLAPDVQRVLRLTRRLPELDRLPVPLARILYNAAAAVFNPCVSENVRVQRPGPNEFCFEALNTQNTRQVYLFLHGGGWTLGSPKSYRSYCSWLATITHSRVYALHYRRAPEHPYPAALDDSLAAYQKLRQRLAADETIVLVGDSAGAQLSLGLCQRLRMLGEPMPASLILHYPVVSAPDQTASYQQFARGLFLSRSMMQWFWRLYRPILEHDEVAILRWREYSWLPPITLCLARHDVLFDEGYALAQALDKAGVLQSLHVEQNLPHAYLNFMSCPSVLKAMEQQMRAFMGADLQIQERA